MTVAVHDVSLRLAADEGAFVPLNCPECGDGLVPEGKTRGREDVATACRLVKQVFYCPDCRATEQLTVTLTRVPEGR